MLVAVRSVEFNRAAVNANDGFVVGKQIIYDLCFSKKIFFGAAVVGFLKTLIGEFFHHTV